MTVRELLGAALLILGVLVVAVAAIGLFRFRRTLDLLQFLVTAGLVVLCGFTVHTVKLVLAAAILWVVNPVSAHLIARMEVITGLGLDPDQLPGEGEQEL